MPAHRPHRLRAGLTAASTLLLGLALGSLAPPRAEEPEPLGGTLPGGRSSGPFSYADVLEPALQAVVHVEAEKRGRSRQARPRLPWFMPQPDDDQGPDRESQGSGVIVRKDGVILTNNHVVEGANRVIVKLADKRELTAKVLGADAASDIAVLQVEDGPMPTIPLGRSADLRIGDVVFALGSPLGLDQTATMGIVSAKGRTDLGITRYDDLVQTDAAINPGNSGGAMINARGELVGINTAILFRGMPSFQGVGLAIPIDIARNVMNQILERGRVVRAYLGVTLEDVDDALARKFGLERPEGAVVTRVLADTPAAEAGLEIGDVILSVDRDEIESLGELRLAISGRSPGDRVRLRVLRGEGERTLTAKLVELPGDEALPSMGEPDRAPEEDWGLSLDDLDDELRERLGLEEDTEGVVVTAVERGSPASREELRPGDVILRIERERVRSVVEARRRMTQLEGDALLLLVRSGDVTRFVVLER